MSPGQPTREAEGGAAETTLGNAWDRFAPLSLGAVASSALIVAASAALRGLLGPRRRALGWLGVAALLPLAVWVLWEDEEEAADPDETEKERSGARTGKSREPNGG